MATTRKTSTTKSKPATRATTKPKTSRAPGASRTPRATAPAEPVQGVTVNPSAATAPEAAAAALPSGPVALTKRELLARVRKSSGVKGRDVRAVTEAVLAELGGALVRGENLKLQPLGTMRVQRQKSSGGADMLVLKLRRKKPVPEGKDPLAEVAE